jgi:hypothetical protein
MPVMKLYRNMKPFMEEVIVIVKTSKVPLDSIRPSHTSKKYTIEGSIADITGYDSVFRPGGKAEVGDIYLEVLAGSIPAKEVGTGNTTSITLGVGDIIVFNGFNHEIKFIRNEPTVVDISDYYAARQEVPNG